MTTINKKFSDFQNNECDTIERVKKEDTQKECPKCVPNPNYKTKGYWFNIKEPYLNEKFCEYHVRVYTADAVANIKMMTKEDVEQKTISNKDIIETAINKFIKHYKKVPSNDNRNIARKNTKILKSNSLPAAGALQGNEDLGRAYLVGIPAMSLDTLKNLKEEDEEKNQPLNKETKEIKIKINGFFRKHIQIMGALRIYQTVYSTIANDGESDFFIYEENNPTKRLNFTDKINQFLEFRKLLSDDLDENGYTRLGLPSILRKAITKIKFVFDADAPGYKLEKVLVLEEKCPDNYIEIDATNLMAVGGKNHDFSFALLDRLDEIVKEITSPETRPWLEFVTEYFYPKMVVEYGNLGSLDPDVVNTLGCLADKYFGSDRLANTFGEILEGTFNEMIQQAYEAACRSINEVSVGGPEGRAQSRKEQPLESLKEKKESARKKYIQFVINQVESTNAYKKQNGLFICQDPNYSLPIFEEPLVTEDETTADEPTPPPSSSPPVSPKPEEYVVQKGDTMWAISKKFNLSINELIALNPQFSIEKLNDWSSDPNNPNYGLPSGESQSKDSDRNPNWIFPDEILIIQKIADASEPEDDPDSEPEAIEPPAQTEEETDTINELLSEPLEDSPETETPPSPATPEPPSDVAEPETDSSASQEEIWEDTFDSYVEELSGAGSDDFQKCLQFEVLALQSRKEKKIISSYKELRKLAKQYANASFEGEGRDWGFGKDGEIRKAWDNAINDENTFVGLITKTVKGEGRDVEFPDEIWPQIISVIGLCGITKLSDNVIKCLLGGLTINQLYDMLIDKFFEFIDFALLDLFLNELPFSIRSQIDDVIQEEFGDGVSITDMINVKKQSEQKLGDVVNFGVINQLEQIFSTTNSIDQLSDDQKTLAFNNLGEEFVKDNINNTYFKDDAPEGAFTKKDIKKQRRKYLKNREFFSGQTESFIKSFNLFSSPVGGDQNSDLQNELLLKERDAFERMNEVMTTSNIGEGFDAVFDVILGALVDYLIDLVGVDALIELISNFPGGEFLVGFVKDFFKSCPHPGIFNPPVDDFLKTFSLDICDPEIGLYIPRLIIPNINLRYQITKVFFDAFIDAIEQLFIKIIVELIQRLAAFLEELICQTLAAIGDSVLGPIGLNSLKGVPNKDSWREALDEAFCGGAKNPETGKSRADELMQSLIEGSKNGLTSQDLEGAGEKATNLISGCAGTEECLAAIIEGNDDLNNIIANACQVLTPELNSILGTPSLVGFFFENLGSFLSVEDKERIRELLDRGVPNIPLTASICLTDDQLDAWNKLREDLLRRQAMQPNSTLFPNGTAPAPGTGADDSDIDPDDIVDIDSIIAEDVNNMNLEVEDALRDVLDDAFELNSDAPFFGALSNELIKDLCDPNNKFNLNSKSDFEKEEDNNFRDEEFQNTMNIFAYGMYGRNGLFGHALRDKEDNAEIKRNFMKLINPNYTNDTAEHVIKLAEAGGFKKARMLNQTGQEGDKGLYPLTVATRLKDYVLNTNNILSSVQLTFTQTASADYNHRITAFDLDRPYGDFGYVINGTGQSKKPSDSDEDNTGSDYLDSILDEFQFEINIEVDDDQKQFIESYGANISEASRTRKHVFNKFIESKILLNKDYGIFYKDLSAEFATKMFDACFTDSRDADGLSDGFKFGYEPDDLTEAAFEYTVPEDADETKTLGTFGDERIIALNPEIYGGRYSNPHFTVRPRNFNGWLGYSTNAFDTVDGCVPTAPPIINMKKIKDDVKKREQRLRDYTDLARDVDCTSEKPFKLLASKEIRADIEGVVRTTIKSYVSEYFFKAAPVLSNIEFNQDNYGAAFSNFIVLKMKDEMSNLGNRVPTQRLKITRTRYWYAFLEQTLQAYENKVKAQEVTPSNRIQQIRNKIAEMQRHYQGATSNIKIKLIKQLKNPGFYFFLLDEQPDHEDLLKMFEEEPERFVMLALARRLEPDNDIFYSGLSYNSISASDIRFASLKKMQFFSKMYAIELYEQECTEILAEMISLELKELTENTFYPKRVTTNIFDIMVGLTSIKSIFPDTSSRIGLTDFYNDFTSQGKYDPGDVPDYVEDKLYIGDHKFKFVVEKYISLSPKEGMSLPDGLKERMSINDFYLYASNLPEEELDKNFSDYFGNLEFIYESNISDLLNAGFSSDLLSIDIEQKEGVTPDYIQNCIALFNMGESLESDKVIIHKSNLIPEGAILTPKGVTGETGVNYGLSIGVISQASNIFESSEIETLSNNINSDGSIFINFTEVEYSMSDMKLSAFNPDSGESKFDLECLVNKMSQSQEYKMLFKLIFPVEMYTSLSALYCSENFMASIGYGKKFEERSDGIDPQLSDDAWDGTTNLFLKNYLRRQFASLYLSNTVDGLGDDTDDESSQFLRLFGSFNPFDYLALPSLKLPWWKKKKLLTKVLDENGDDCANPAKDFR